jgi:hypothetical protein
MFMLTLPSGIFSELFGFAQLLSSIAHASLFSIDVFQNILGNKDLSLLRRSLESHYPSNRQSFFSVINFPSFVELTTSGYAGGPPANAQALDPRKT